MVVRGNLRFALQWVRLKHC